VHTKNWAALAKSFPKFKGQVHTIIYWGNPEAVNHESATAQGMKVYSFDEFLALGEQNPVAARPTNSEDLCTIMYTSGTTGMPKGVMIPQSMMLSCMGGMVGCIDSVRGFTPLNETDVMLSYLPLAHVFDRMIEEQILANGASIGFYSGDVKAVIDDIAALRPTIFIGVPRVYDRIYAGVIDQITKAGGLKKRLFDFAFSRKLKYIKQGYPYNKASPFFDRLVFSKIKQRLGGRVRGAISGGAPLSPHVEEFMAVALCCHFSQGYGLTETCGSSFLGNGEVGHFGTIGLPSTSIEYRLESIPEMKYDALAEVPRGEICIRGPMVFPGYYKDDEKTAEVLDKDGWFHTGDVGELNMESGGLKIIDRKKQIFKLSQGEYVAVERIESAYKKLPLIAQIFVYGNSMESMLVAAVVPEEGPFLEAARKVGLTGSFREVLQQPKAKEMLLEQMNATAKEAKMKGFEMVRGIILDEEPFSVENGLMTPTFKLKRHQLQEKYMPQITPLYKELNTKRP
jgi:long-chain acyl-CoA synthetase